MEALTYIMLGAIGLYVLGCFLIRAYFRIKGEYVDSLVNKARNKQNGFQGKK